MKVALALMLLALTGIWVGIGFELLSRWTVPLGPALAWPTLAPVTLPMETFTPQPLPLAVGDDFTPPPTFSPPTARPQPIIPTRTPRPNAGIPYCGGPETMTLLLIGSDTRADGYAYGLADIVRLMRVDFVYRTVTVLDFPRDLWVQIPEISDHYGITHEKLNQSYLYGNRGFGYYDGPDFGPGLLALTLDLNFGARPEHYFAINMQTFVRLVDALGGVDINLPYPVDGRMPDQQSRSDLYVPAGQQTLSGREALTLARLRIGTNADRTTNQSRVVCALRDTALKPSNFARLPEIINAFQGAVQTDLSPQQISALACLAPQILPGSIRFVSFPDDAMTATRTYDPRFKKQVFIYEPDLALMRLYTAAFQRGDWPPAPSIQSVTQQTPTSDEESFSCP